MQSARWRLEEPTFPMDPQERPIRFPFCKYAALEEPPVCRGSFMSCFPNEVLIRRRIRNGEPVLNIP